MDFAMGNFGGFDALDALAGAAQTLLPLGAGVAVTFGTTEAVNLLVTNSKVKKWKWAFGLAAGLLLGGAMWAWKSPEDGASTIGAAILTAAVGYGHERILAYQIKKAGGVVPAELGRYLVEKPQPLFAGRYVTSPAEPMLAGLGPSKEIVDLGNFINPGVFVAQ